MNHNPPAYNASITIIKLFAFIGIMLFHLHLFPPGSQGIIVFVICSGYSYLYLYHKNKEKAYARIFYHQVQKLLLALLISYFIMALMDGLFFHRYSIPKIIASYFFIFCGVFVSEISAVINYGLSAGGTGMHLPYFPSNAVLWFISLLLWLYILFPLLHKAMRSRFNALVFILLLMVNVGVRNYSAFEHPANSIMANLLNFYIGMLVFTYETEIVKKIRENRLMVLMLVCMAAGLFATYGNVINYAVTYGIMMFFAMYSLLSMAAGFNASLKKALYTVNPLIMFLVFLHIPAQSIRGVVSVIGGQDNWQTSSLPYGAYFLYTFLIAAVANKLYNISYARFTANLKGR